MQADTIGNRLKEVQDKTQDLATFGKFSFVGFLSAVLTSCAGKMVKLVSFAPFQGASQALENANDISEGIMSNYLAAVIEANVPKPANKTRITLGVADKNLASSIKASFPYLDCETAETSEVAADLLRGLRQHSQKLLKQLQDGDVERAQLGLGHGKPHYIIIYN
jgi:nucleolar protein 56